MEKGRNVISEEEGEKRKDVNRRVRGEELWKK